MDILELRYAVMDALSAVRERNPLAGSVTNGVTMDFVANAQLAVGGSAAMVYLPDEGEDLVRMGESVYVNMGTLQPVYERTIPAVLRAAHEADKTCVLDPVGIGIGELRTKLLLEVKQYRPKLVRANASEVIALAGLWGLEGSAGDLTRARGVDSSDPVEAARSAAIALARYTDGAVAVSGEVDLITDGMQVACSRGGSPLMEKVTGCGCSLGGVCAVYAAVANPFVAAVAASAHYNVAGARAERVANAPASFKTAFLDELYRVEPRDVAMDDLTLEDA